MSDTVTQLHPLCVKLFVISLLQKLRKWTDNGSMSVGLFLACIYTMYDISQTDSCV
jgi:hypothetical protein